MPEPKFEGQNQITVFEKLEWEGGEATITYAGPEDRQGIIEADKGRERYRREKYNVTKTKEALEKENAWPLEERMADDNFIFLVLKVGDEIAGYIEIKNEPESGGMVETETLSVLEKYFRNKFGTHLMEQGIEEAQKKFGAKAVHLWTNKNNYPASQFYENEKFGFKKTGEERVNEGETWAGEPSVSIGMVKHLDKE